MGNRYRFRLNTSGGGGGGGTGDLVANETFETPTTGYVLSGWTTDNGSPSTTDPAYTAAPINGSQSMQVVQAGNNAGAFRTVTLTSEVWGRFRVKWTSGNGYFLRLVNGSSAVFGAGINTGVAFAIDHGNNSSAASSNTLSSGSSYYFWFHYKAGTGGSALAECAFSAGATNPGYSAPWGGSTTGGNANLGCNKLTIGAPTLDTITYVIDDFNLSSTNNL